MAVSDRIAVMDRGRIAHCSTPQNIYMRPANLFVASFIGRTNILAGTLAKSGGAYTLRIEGGYEMPLDSLDTAKVSAAMGGGAELPVQVSIRPEDFVVAAGGGLPATIESSVFLGNTTQYFLRVPGGERIEIVQESAVDHILPVGSEVALSAKAAKLNVYSADGETNYTDGVVNDCGEG